MLIYKNNNTKNTLVLNTTPLFKNNVLCSLRRDTCRTAWSGDTRWATGSTAPGETTSSPSSAWTPPGTPWRASCWTTSRSSPSTAWWCRRPTGPAQGPPPSRWSPRPWRMVRTWAFYFKQMFYWFVTTRRLIKVQNNHGRKQWHEWDSSLHEAILVQLTKMFTTVQQGLISVLTSVETLWIVLNNIRLVALCEWDNVAWYFRIWFV